jgi:hypothetical protein
MERECFETLSPKLALKRRPSSGIPMKKGELMIKRRKNSFNECSRSYSIDIKHIDALKFSPKSHSPRGRHSPRGKDKNLASPNCICLKPMDKSPLQVRGGHYESIDPW